MPANLTTNVKCGLLINASNLHVGGGVQVGTSVIGELTQMSALPRDLVIWASSAVDANLRQLGYQISVLPKYEVVNSYGKSLLWSPLHHRLQQFAAVFTIFGPLYARKLAGVNITGFAQAWIIYPNNELYAEMSFTQQILTKLKFKLQSLFFARADQFVVELEHVKAGLLQQGITNSNAVHVVNNCLSSLYLTPSSWQSLAVPEAPGKIKLGFVGRNYLHKNTRIFPAIINELRDKYGLQTCIYVTFTDEEWAACSQAFRADVINVGPLFVAQCPTFYNAMDAVVFPSLLESFSATPLEALAMKKPLFASDRPFNRDICQEYAYYFDPLSPQSAACAIARVFSGSRESNNDFLAAAKEHALNFSTAKLRAERYLALLMQASNMTSNESKKGH